jgi:hypothetical protein
MDDLTQLEGAAPWLATKYSVISQKVLADNRRRHSTLSPRSALTSRDAKHGS